MDFIRTHCKTQKLIQANWQTNWITFHNLQQYSKVILRMWFYGSSKFSSVTYQPDDEVMVELGQK